MIDPFPILLAGHAVGDWVVQSDWQATYKSRPDCWPSHARSSTSSSPGPVRYWEGQDYRRSWRANHAHMLGYHAMLALCLVPWIWSVASRSPLFPFLGALVFSWAVHSFIDRRWPVRWLLEHTGSRSFAKTSLGILAADQALHIITLAIMALWLQAVVR